MKATELKLGDLVSCHGEILTVAFCDMFMCSAWDENEDLCDDINYDELSPIPLTEEILEKNGWEERERPEGIVYVSGWYGLSRVEQDASWTFSHYDDFLTKIESVHELQHLLWALGIDDDLKITECTN